MTSQPNRRHLLAAGLSLPLAAPLAKASQDADTARPAKNGKRILILGGTRFLGRVAATTAEGVLPEVEGMAHRVGSSTFELDPRDPLAAGFSLR